MEDFESLVMKDGFHVQFCARYLEVELDPHRIIPPLLKQAQQLADMAEPPESQNDCKDCKRVDELIHWLSPPKKIYQENCYNSETNTMKRHFYNSSWQHRDGPSAFSPIPSITDEPFFLISTERSGTIGPNSGVHLIFQMDV
jgi:hypothetical protein